MRFCKSTNQWLNMTRATMFDSTLIINVLINKEKYTSIELLDYNNRVEFV